MCFSPTASFGASIVLSVIGIAAIKKTNKKSQLMFASIPLVFGIQQLLEGVLWLALPNPEMINLQRYFTYSFIFVAQVIWPIWVPVSILLMKKNRNSVKFSIQKILVVIGVVVGCYLGFCLLNYHVEAKIFVRHIRYLQDYPQQFKIYFMFLYALATIIPPLFSPVKGMWLLSASILVAYVITYIFYRQYVLSVWCFFSSIISLSVYFIMFKVFDSETEKKHALIKKYFLS